MKDIFICYSREDIEEVEKLARGLKERGLNVWYDLEGISVGDYVLDTVRKAILDIFKLNDTKKNLSKTAFEIALKQLLLNLEV